MVECGVWDMCVSVVAHGLSPYESKGRAKLAPGTPSRWCGTSDYLGKLFWGPDPRRVFQNHPVLGQNAHPLLSASECGRYWEVVRPWHDICLQLQQSLRSQNWAHRADCDSTWQLLFHEMRSGHTCHGVLHEKQALCCRRCEHETVWGHNRGTLHEEAGRDWSSPGARQGTPRLAAHPRKLEEAGKTSNKNAEEAMAGLVATWFGTWVFKSVRKQISVVSLYPLCDILLW